MNQTEIRFLKRLLEEYRVLVDCEYPATFDTMQVLNVHIPALVEYIEADLKNPENRP